ncbi:hypothetical protein [Desulfosporosinus fructosivorans]
MGEGKNRRFRFGSLFIGQIEVNHVNKAFLRSGGFSARHHIQWGKVRPFQYLISKNRETGVRIPLLVRRIFFYPLFLLFFAFTIPFHSLALIME